MTADWRMAGLLAAAMASSVPGAAWSADYLDDRSSAETLVRSLYNAVSRKEYARAWDYFGDQKPAKDFKAFVEGYAGTERVDIETGAASEEGAAGSLYYQVPVAIRAVGSDGSEQTFAGCYTARLAQPANQEPPFRPLQLEKGSLKAAKGDLSQIVPASCGDGPAPEPRDKVRSEIEKAFRAAYASTCQTLQGDAEPGAADPEIKEIVWQDSEGGADRKVRLFRFGCTVGAYNTGEVYYQANDDGEFRQLQFAEPELDIRYENGDFEGKLESVTVVGFRTVDTLANSFYDDKTQTIQSASKWRGVGDASSAGTYLFRNGAFSLTKYEVDASYDGEINPETVVDYDTAP